MTVKTTVAQLVTATTTSREQFTPGRYPWTYAADFIREHPHVVPAAIREQVDVDNPALYSRSEAAHMKTLWAKAEGREERELAEVLADAFLQVHGIRRD